jgi:hypothetical protein
MLHGPYIKRPLAPQLKSERDRLHTTASAMWQAIQELTEIHDSIETAIGDIDEARSDIDRDELRTHCSETCSNLSDAGDMLDNWIEHHDAGDWKKSIKTAHDESYQAM